MKKQLLIIAVCFLSAVAMVSSTYAREHSRSHGSSYGRSHASRSYGKRSHGSRFYGRTKWGSRLNFGDCRRSSFSFGWRNKKSGFSISFGGKPYCRRPVVYCRPRPICRGPIIRMIRNDYRLYQPRVHGHPAFLQRWSEYGNRWINMKKHPSIY